MMELVAYGSQDVYLIGDLQITIEDIETNNNAEPVDDANYDYEKDKMYNLFDVDEIFAIMHCVDLIEQIEI